MSSRFMPLGVLGVLMVAVLGLILTDLLVSGLRGVGFAVCHQIPSHSLFIAGQQLPLCARDTGIYLGFLVGILGLVLLGKLRASRLPPRNVSLLLLLAIAAMGVDGTNSLLASFFPELPHAYEPINLLRLATGIGAGVAFALLLVPLLNESIWRQPQRMQSVDDVGDLLGYLILAVFVGALVYSENPSLLYPVSILSVLGVFATLSTAAAALVGTLVGPARRATTLAQASGLLGGGLILTSVAILALGLARAYFTSFLLS